MTENELAGQAFDICFRLHKQYGPGLFESVYEELFCYELSKTDIPFTRQFPIPLVHENIRLACGFRADIILENKILVELKSVESLTKIHFKQVLTYLRLADFRLGLLINFNEVFLKDGIHRIVNRL